MSWGSSSIQWHHLLAGLNGGRFDDLRFQILADGLFHAIMYLVAGVGLWLLWRSRRESVLAGADRLLVANGLIGFGAWHVIDGVASHWVLGIHRIKMDSDTPLLWDLLWFIVFGVVFVIWGRMLKSGRPRSGKGIAGAPGVIVALVILTGAVSLLPPDREDGSVALVMFRPGANPARAMAAVTGIGGRMIWSDERDGVWALDLPEGASVLELYRGGALLISNGLLPAGCLNWFEKSSSSL